MRVTQPSRRSRPPAAVPRLTTREAKSRLVESHPGLIALFTSMTSGDEARILRRLCNPRSRQAGVCELAMLYVMRFGVASTGLARQGGRS